MLGIALPPERQDHQNVVKLKALDLPRWGQLVDLIHRHKGGTDPAEAQKILNIKGMSDVEINAAISNMTRVINALHDPNSKLLSALKDCLSQGKLCVVDISQMRGAQGLQLAGVILGDIFEHNQNQFTEADPKSIPTIAVIEEAQSVLGGSNQSEDGPFVSWVKEGRKYDLGALLITQQPGSLPHELLSQGDNFFVFHLLSQGDLVSLKKANAHFSDDLLATLLNEPLVGNGIYWSSAPGTDQNSRPYPISVRVLSFEDGNERADPKYDKPAPEHFAAQERFRVDTRRREAKEAAAALASRHTGDEDIDDTELPADDGAIAILHLDNTTDFHSRIKSARGIKWSHIAYILKTKAPEHAVRTSSDWQWGYELVLRALNELYPDQWIRDRRDDDTGKVATFVMLKEYGPESESESDVNDTPIESAQNEEEPPF
ncbi:hypothetical protein BJF83_14330 [Nocardiopsis sp. CNR-923]|nr:hypothetical protein BJF83_14330 [Nocardiopsis sp. CNR-923]